MKKNIGTNVSSGAKKVERVEELTPQDANAKSAPAPAPKKKRTSSKRQAAVKREKKAADRRVEAARARAGKKEQKLEKKAELKAKKLEKKAALKEQKLEKKRALAERKLAKKEALQRKKTERAEKKAERKAALKERRVERRAEKIARRELLKNETKAEKEKRIAREKREHAALRRRKAEAREKARADRRQARENAHARKAEERKHKREQRTERRRHAPGFGGWLAAVISLGTACLALATVVTAGAIRMNDITVDVEGGYRSTLYEMVSVSEQLDDDLSKLRVSSGSNEQRKLLTDILVDAALMESALERIPVDNATSTDISAFVNGTGSYARTLLGRIAAGGTLTPAEKERVAQLYEINDKLYNELNTLATTMTAGELRAFLGGNGPIADRFGELAQGTKEEPRETEEAPFADEGNVGENALSSLPEIAQSEAEELARKYFEAYHMAEVRFAGETVAAASCYNFTLIDENGLEIYAQITKNGGKLAFFDTYEACTQKNFDLETCDAIAREYLAGLGIADVEAVWLSDGGMVANLTYTTVREGVRVYPEIIRIRVCEEKGRVVGMDARGYLLNARERSFGAAMDESEARARLSEGLQPYAVHLALVPVDGREVLAYEYGCTYGEDEYIVYLDAQTGEEVQVFRVRTSARGSYLR